MHHQITSQHNSAHTIRNTPKTINNQANSIATQSPNNSNIIECLQLQILGLQMQALQQSTLNSIKIFDSNNKSKFTSRAQSVEYTAKLCTMDTLTIGLSNYREPHLNQLISLNPKMLAQVSN